MVRTSLKNKEKDISPTYIQLIALDRSSDVDISRISSHDHDAPNKYQCDLGCYFNQKTEQEIKNAQKAANKLLCALIFCIIFMIIEFIGGYIAHSIALMSDAMHLLSDCIGILISVISLWMTQKSATNKLTYGYYRAEIVGALFSVFLIWVLTLWLVYEAIIRLIHPEDVRGASMFIVACCGIIVNIIMSGILHQGHHDHHDHHHHNNNSDESASTEIAIINHSHCDDDHHHSNMNVRSAFIHAVGDLLQSIGVLIAAGLIWYDNKKYSIADPICTLIFSVIVLFTTVNLMRDILSVLMESVPSNLNLDEIEYELKNIEDVHQIHDLHVWNLTMDKHILSVHLVLKSSTIDSEGNIVPACADCILRNAHNILDSVFKIRHSTIQIEWSDDEKHGCGNSNDAVPFYCDRGAIQLSKPSTI